jgi:hypothetical protein
MEIVHRPVLNTKRVEELYTEKDGVSVTYVCSSALDDSEKSVDIFYRDTPHPIFGNRYFGLYYSDKGVLYITNADKIEGLSFAMIQSGVKLHYSKDRHDYNQIGDIAIDGGRAYCRLIGNLAVYPVTMRVKNGKFVNG